MIARALALPLIAWLWLRIAEVESYRCRYHADDLLQSMQDDAYRAEASELRAALAVQTNLFWGPARPRERLPRSRRMDQALGVALAIIIGLTLAAVVIFGGNL